MIKRTAVERCPLFSIETGFYLKAPGILFVIERKKKQMNHETIQKLQFTTILKEVQTRAIGEYSKERLAKMVPATRLETVQSRLTETTEARLIIDSGQHVPFMGLSQITRLLQQVKKGLILTPNELIEVADFLRSSQRIQKFFEKNQYQTPRLFSYSQHLADFRAIEEQIYTKIHNQKVATDASRQLRKIRRQINECQQEIETKVTKFLRNKNNQLYIQENMMVKKGEHYTVPIKASYKNKVSGTIIEQSNKGQTVFIEPVAISKLNEQLTLLKAEETAEEYQILAELTGLINEQERLVDQAVDTMTTLDIIFARGKYSREIGGITPKVNKEERLRIVQGKHPLLLEHAVPLTFSLGAEYRGLVITGANAGGKTVVLKTVGLLTVMTQFGLQIPAQAGTEIPVLDEIFVDIGDQQNLENALSTFSGHMKNIAEMLRNVKRHTLVLLDEIGSGTEPNEGAGLAIAIMETMYQKGALVVATTHYGEIKRFAQEHDDFVPAAMAFDRETLTPKYQLKIGEVGDSQALWIARKMKMEPQLIEKAAHYIQRKEYPTNRSLFKPLKAKETTFTTFVEETDRYQKGDRVLLTETQQIGLVFTDEGEQEIQVFVNDKIENVPRRRLKLQAKAQDLYPQDYDLESLFTDFHERKKLKDIERGSKKAQKQLRKEAEKRAARREK
ncbi:endonuclease MutS2 [Enterococcus faecalis]|uniref:endonuclease MutS2 n=2 Tax=Enterococcus TaxID=1350 RepID=UPI00046C892C|nr:mannonate oxidoreductase [Enterococcus faecalis]EGO2587740.1 endonuclease MutS2 [Enterococcus faecalis]EGO5851544.1 endonuclease MutS2 [Enterococcus faecalis]EJI7261136.1 endonuclease MutS2 [Enterococcus faecalis]NSM75105.1 endonuclease MutS2 [Enterococcus faecalis]HBC4454347.1 endonuclease MutS2 [Enterococcus faecalis]